MSNRLERYQWVIIPGFLMFLLLIIEVLLSLSQVARYKDETKPYYVTPILRPLVRLFVKDDYVPRTLSMYEWPWDYKTDRARPGYYPSPVDNRLPPYTINSFGIRGKDFQIPKPKGTFRIVVFGGSSTFGAESPDNQTYPARLEELLNKQADSQNIEVLNYGGHSKSMYWIAQQYFREIAKIDPDMVIVNNIRNTYFDQSQKWTHYSDIITPQRAQITKLHLFLSDNLLLYRFLRRAVEETQLSVLFKPLIKTEYEKKLAYSGITKQALPSFFNVQYPEVVEGMYLEAKKRGIKFMMVLEPVRCQPEDKSGTTCWDNAINKQPFYYESFRQALKKVQNKNPGMLILDPVEEMIRLADREKDPMAVFSDGQLHLTPKGNVLFAEIIARKLSEEKILPAR